MGLLGKYATFRWLSQGSGDGGGGGGILLILLVFMGFFLIMFAIQAALSFIYDTIRSGLMIAPNLLTLLVGAALAFLAAAATTPNTPEQASEYLASSNFVAKSVLALVCAAGILTGYELGFLVPPGEAETSLLIAGVYLVSTFYCLYSLYRATKLVGALEQPSRYQLAILFPLTTAFVYAVFSLPLYSLLGTIISIGAFAVLPLTIAAIHYRVKPTVNTVGDTEADPV